MKQADPLKCFAYKPAPCKNAGANNSLCGIFGSCQVATLFLTSWSPIASSPMPRSRAALRIIEQTGITFLSKATKVISLSSRHGMVCFSNGPVPDTDLKQVA